MPVLSVITPCYNNSAFLAKTIESVQAQSFTDWEMIVVDDCSADSSYDIACAFAQSDPRIRAFRLERNRGSSAARNHGLRHSSGQYVTFIDGDDIVLPEKFERQIAFMRRHGHAITFTNYRRMTPDETQTGILIRNPARIDYDYLLKHTAMGTLTPVYDRTQTGDFYFDETLSARMDYAFWLDVLARGHSAYRLDEDLARYRRGHKSLSSNLFKGARLVWRVLKHRQKLSRPRAAWCFAHYAFFAVAKRRVF